MKTISFLILIFVLFLLTLSCTKNNPVDTNDSIPKPPVQINEYDLVGLEGMKILSFAVNPNEPWRILASTFDSYGYGRVYITSNYGKTWSIVIDSIYSHTVAWDLQKPNAAYVSRLAQFGQGPHLFKSTDYGNSWFRSDSGIVMFDTHITRISINSLNSDILYTVATTQPISTHYSTALYKSVDGGKNWQRIDLPGNPFDDTFGNNQLFDLVINNANPQIMFVGLWGLSYNFGKTIDGGITWRGKSIISYEVSFMKLSNSKNLLLTILYRYPPSIPNLAISRDAGENFEVINNDRISRSTINDILVVSEDLIFTSFQLRTNKDSSFVFFSKDQGYNWIQLGSDYDRKTFLDHDIKNNFLYVVKDGVKKGLYRYKIK